METQTQRFDNVNAKSSLILGRSYFIRTAGRQAYTYCGTSQGESQSDREHVFRKREIAGAGTDGLSTIAISDNNLVLDDRGLVEQKIGFPIISFLALPYCQEELKQLDKLRGRSN